MAERDRGKGNGDSAAAELPEESELCGLDDKETIFVEAITGPTNTGNIRYASEQAGYSPHYGYAIIQRPHVELALAKVREAKVARWRTREDEVIEKVVNDALEPPTKPGQWGGPDNDAAYKNRELYFKLIGRLSSGSAVTQIVTNTSQAGGEESVEDSIRRISAGRELRVRGE